MCVFGVEPGDKIDEFIWGTENFQPFSNPKLEMGPGVSGIESSEKYQPGVTEGVIEKAEKTEEGKSTLPTVPKR
jgi:hypothetical protein